MRLLPTSIALAVTMAFFAVPAAAEAPSEAQVRAVLPTWCKYKNEERTKLQKEADKLFGYGPTAPPGKTVTVEMVTAHHDAMERWKEPRLKALNDAFQKTTGLDYYAATRVATEHRLFRECT